jgi:hypothetical protein
MIVAKGHDALLAQIAAARTLLDSPEVQWAEAHRIQWGRALDDIVRFIDGDDDVRGFSIIRQLDSGPGMKSPMGEALLGIAAELRRSGITRFH